MEFNKNNKKVVTAALTATMLVSAVVPVAAATVSKAQHRVIQAHCTNATLLDARTLKITFNKKLKSNTVSAADFTVNSGDVTSATVSKDELSVILKLDKNLKSTAVSGITFDLKANKKIAFINGDQLKKETKPLSQSLTIVDQSAPTLVSYKITDTDEITLTFTESIKNFNISGADAIAAVVKVYGYKISSIKNVNGKIVIKTSEPITGTPKIELKSGQAVLTDTSGNKYAGSDIKVLVVDQVSIDLAVAKRAVDGYVEASLKTLSEVTTAKGLEATAQAKVNAVTDPKAKKALQKRIDDQKVVVTSAKTELIAQNEIIAQKEATKAIDGYIGASLTTLEEITSAEGLEATAQAKVNSVTDAKAKTALQKRIDDQKVVVTTAKTELIAQNNALIAAQNEIRAQNEATKAIDGYVGASLKTLLEVTTAEGLEATAQAKVNAVTDPKAKTVLQKRIDDQKIVVAAAKTELTVQDDATKVIDGYVGAPLKTLLEVTTAEGLEATAQAKVNAVTDAKAKVALQKRIDDQKVVVATAKTELTAQKEATKAIDGYIGASLTTLEEVTTAEGFEATAQAKVNAVTDATAKAALQKRIDDQKVIVTTAKTELTAQKSLTDARTALTNAIQTADQAQKAAVAVVDGVSEVDQTSLGKAYTDYQATVTSYGNAVIAALTANTLTASTTDLTTAKTTLDGESATFATAKTAFESTQKTLLALPNAVAQLTNYLKTYRTWTDVHTLLLFAAPSGFNVGIVSSSNPDFGTDGKVNGKNVTSDVIFKVSKDGLSLTTSPITILILN